MQELLILQIPASCFYYERITAVKLIISILKNMCVI